MKIMIKDNEGNSEKGWLFGLWCRGEEGESDGCAGVTVGVGMGGFRYSWYVQW